ncbi:MAG TPA: 30S ribosomal protein S18 [bacterium]|jgi:small subunit ribosomal protein S18|nr:30S ribosomal protein S18 [bacterium]
MPPYNRGKPRKRSFNRRKVCRFCADREVRMDYKNPKMLSLFITERGKIIPRRITGNCALHQRSLTTAVKRARVLALIPFTATHA